jgi:hypothetical protein
MSASVTRRCRTCGWKGTYSSVAKADYAKRRHSCARNLEKSRRAENGRRIAAEHAKIDRTPKPCHHKETTHQHGTHACYVLDRCKCLPCAKANSDYEAARARRNAYGRSNLVSAAPARAHVLHLMDQGMGLKRIIAVGGLSSGQLWKLLYGKRKADGSRTPSKRIRRDTEQRILAIQLDLADGARVDGTDAVRRLQSLVALGWSMAKLADRLGILGSNFTPIIHGRRQLTVATATAANALFDELSMTLPPNQTHRDKIAFSRARNYAAAAGWVPPLELEDLVVDVELDDDETPAIDEAAVWRSVNGDRDVQLTAADRQEVIRTLHRRGLTDTQIGQLTGFKSVSIERKRLGLPVNRGDRIDWSEYGEKSRPQRERQSA